MSPSGALLICDISDIFLPQRHETWQTGRRTDIKVLSLRVLLCDQCYKIYTIITYSICHNTRYGHNACCCWPGCWFGREWPTDRLRARPKLCDKCTQKIVNIIIDNVASASAEDLMRGAGGVSECLVRMPTS